MKNKLRKLIGITLMALTLSVSTVPAFACDDRSGDGCIPTPSWEWLYPTFQGDGWVGPVATIGGVVAWLGFVWGSDSDHRGGSAASVLNASGYRL